MSKRIKFSIDKKEMHGIKAKVGDRVSIAVVFTGPATVDYDAEYAALNSGVFNVEGFDEDRDNLHMLLRKEDDKK